MNTGYKKEKNLTIKFIKKIFKNGNKYKLYKNYKNFWIFFKILKKNLKKKTKFKLKNSLIISKYGFKTILGLYSTNIALKIIKKKKIKSFISYLLLKKKKNLEILKIWKLLLLKTKIRTLKFRIYYLLLSFLLKKYFMLKINKKAKIINKIAKKKIFFKKKKNINNIFEQID